MEPESRTTKRSLSRRNLLRTGAVGVLGAAAATGLTAGPASANDGDPIILGQNNIATSPTHITLADSRGDYVDIFPTSDDGPVLQVETEHSGPAMLVISLGATGISAAGEGTGIEGFGNLDLGVSGNSTTGIGVKGFTEVGTGIKAEVGEPQEGTAFEASGPVKFSTSGLADIAASTDRVIVDPGVPVTTQSKILALLQGNSGNKAAVERVVPYPSTNTFKIVLTKSSRRSVQVAWFLIS